MELIVIERWHLIAAGLALLPLLYWYELLALKVYDNFHFNSNNILGIFFVIPTFGLKKAFNHQRSCLFLETFITCYSLIELISKSNGIRNLAGYMGK